MSAIDLLSSMRAETFVETLIIFFHALLFLLLLDGQLNNEDVAKRHMRKEKEGKIWVERSVRGWRPEQQNIILK